MNAGELSHSVTMSGQAGAMIEEEDNVYDEEFYDCALCCLIILGILMFVFVFASIISTI